MSQHWGVQEAPPAPEKEVPKALKELVAEPNPHRMVFTGNAKVPHAISHMAHALWRVLATCKRSGQMHHQVIICDIMSRHAQKQTTVVSGKHESLSSLLWIQILRCVHEAIFPFY